jgi:hypothetical protein
MSQEARLSPDRCADWTRDGMNTSYGRADPLHVRADIAGPIRLPAPALDALLGSVVVIRDGIAPAAHEGELVSLSIPIAREPGGRFYLASFAQCQVERRELRYTQKRFPIEEAQMLGRDLGVLRINAGPAKAHRIPYETALLVGDVIDWWCIGDAEEIRRLLAHVPHIGKRRGVGLGRVVCWSVEPCEPWDGFPVVRDGRPLRTLPADWPGLVEPMLGYATLDMPYWVMTRESICAVPELAR